MTKTIPWNRILWGVKFTSSKGESLLAGDAWDHHCLTWPHYEGEPTRTLLFMTRDQARQWCKEKMATYEGRTDSCAKWKFTPVRVREIVTEL